MKLRPGGAATGLLGAYAQHLYGWPALLIVLVAFTIGAVAMWWDGPRRGDP